MNSSDIFLIIICSAGLTHGVALAVYFWFINPKRTHSNILLGFILFLLGVRVGKSVVLQFNKDLEFLFIFLGLSTLLLIGPLLYGYLKSMTQTNFKILKQYYLQLIPFICVLTLSPFITEQWFIDNGKYWAYILLFGIYLHLAFYISLSAIALYSLRKYTLDRQKTKPQKAVLAWLFYVIIGITIIWCTYVLNIFENEVPYILGPLIYTISIYVLTYKGYNLNISKLSSVSFENNNTDTLIYKEIITIIEREPIFMSPDITLEKLAALSGHNKHVISATINSYAQMNFNALINYYRIQKAKEILSSKEASKYTISSIAYDIGFNSLSSFNAAFKKFEKITPSYYRTTSE